MKEGRKLEYPEKTPDDELQKMPHTKSQRFKPQARLEPAQEHWWQARKAVMLTVTPRVAPFLYMTCLSSSTKLIGLSVGLAWSFYLSLFVRPPVCMSV